MKLTVCVLCLLCGGFAVAEDVVKMDLGVSGVIAISQNTDDSPHLYGGMINGGVIVNDHHRFSLSVGVLAGSEKEALSGPEFSASSDVDITSVPIIVAYDYIWKPSNKVELYAGVRGGVMLNSYDMSASGSDDELVYDFKEKEKATETLIGLGMGARFILTPKSNIYVGYEYWKVFADNPVAKALELPAESMDPAYHVIKVGYSYTF